MRVSSEVTFTLKVFTPTSRLVCRPSALASSSASVMSLPSRYATMAWLSLLVGRMVIWSTSLATLAV